MNAFAARALAAASTQLGVRETGRNRGPQVDRYLAAVGLAPGAPWCAAFTYWCVNEAARALEVTNPVVRTGYCPTIAGWAERKGVLFAEPQAGDMFLLYSSRARHVGFVTKVADRAVWTIEGNTNLGGSPEGIGVFARRRGADVRRLRFVRWWSLAEAGGRERDGGGFPGGTFKLFVAGREWFDMPVLDGHALCPVRAWAQRLGFSVRWDAEEQAVLLDGRELDVELRLIDGTAYAPVRDLVDAAGLVIERVEERAVYVARPGAG